MQPQLSGNGVFQLINAINGTSNARNQMNVARPGLIGANVIGGLGSSGQTSSGPMLSSSPYMNMMFKSPLRTPGLSTLFDFCRSVSFTLNGQITFY